MKTVNIHISGLFFLFSGAFCLAQEAGDGSAGTIKLDRPDVSFQYEVERAIDRGLEFLLKVQNEEGWWSTEDHPALTGLALTAFMGHPRERYQDLPLTLKKGYGFLEENVKPDGRIYRNSMANYNTAIATMAFAVSEVDDYQPIIANARTALLASQVDMGKQGELDTPFDGGVGYNDKYEHSDLNNTLVALETLYYTRNLKERQVDQDKDLDFEAAIHFIEHCQNLKPFNEDEWVSEDPADVGGFFYMPGESKAGERKDPETGRVALRSYGSISYAGLLSYIYADLDKNDPRIQAVLKWLQENYTLEENPGMGLEGYYYYLHLMTKALSSIRKEALVMKDGAVIEWPKQVAKRLINLQQTDGSWINTNGRWWEKDPVLVTAYAVMSLELIYSQL